MKTITNKNWPAAIFPSLICLLFVACSRQPAAQIQPAQPSTESFVTTGDYEMHFNAVRSDQLTADIARAYGIERSKNKVLLNISVLNRTNGGNAATEANVTVLARNLSNQVKDMALRRITEGGAIYYIGTVDIGSGSETLVFEINAVPSGSANTITAKLTREFFAN
jgi:hypothetical protein